MDVPKTYPSSDAMYFLSRAHWYATKQSGCTKVQVGCVIVLSNGDMIFGANVTVPPLCKTERGCQRIELYGENSKLHREPADCRAVHSEVDAICTAAKKGIAVDNATIYITRYPCEACARTIVRAGISKVYYGRQQEISAQTKEILDFGGVECVWVKEFEAEDVFT